MWVIGLQFKNINNIQLDLAQEIQAFSYAVYDTAVLSKMNQENLKLDPRYRFFNRIFIQILNRFLFY